MIRDYGVKGMKKGVRKAANAVVSGSAARGVAKAGIRKAAGTAKKAILHPASIATGIAKNASTNLRQTASKPIATSKKLTLGKLSKSAYNLSNRNRATDDDLILDYGVKGMKKGVRHEDPTSGGASGGGSKPTFKQKYQAGKFYQQQYKANLKQAKSIAKATGQKPDKQAMRQQAHQQAWDLAQKTYFPEVYKKRMSLERKSAKTSDSIGFNTICDNLFDGGRKMRKRYRLDEDVLLDDDEMILEDDDEMILEDEDEFTDEDELMEDEDEFVEVEDDDELMEDEDEILEDEDEMILEDEDEFMDEDELMEDGDEILEDDDEMIVEDDDEFIEDDDEEPAPKGVKAKVLAYVKGHLPGVEVYKLEKALAQEWAKVLFKTNKLWYQGVSYNINQLKDLGKAIAEKCKNYRGIMEHFDAEEDLPSQSKVKAKILAYVKGHLPGVEVYKLEKALAQEWKNVLVKAGKLWYQGVSYNINQLKDLGKAIAEKCKTYKGIKEYFDEDVELKQKANSILNDARRTLRDARRHLKRLRRRDAIILNDEEPLLEDEDEELALDDDLILEDDDEMILQDDDETILEDEDEILEDDDEMILQDRCSDDDDVELSAAEEITDADESEAINTDKTKALRELTEASRGISDPVERKQLQDAIYKVLCGRTQMADVMRITKKNRKARTDSAANKNVVSMEKQQAIYDSFNPHKKTSF